MPVTTWGANARPAIAATSGGVIVAWIDERGGRATVGLRAVGLETLCTDPRAAAPDSLNFEWTPWPSRSRALAHHD
jgi:hypothetical protein